MALAGAYNEVSAYNRFSKLGKQGRSSSVASVPIAMNLDILDNTNNNDFEKEIASYKLISGDVNIDDTYNPQLRANNSA